MASVATQWRRQLDQQVLRALAEGGFVAAAQAEVLESDIRAGGKPLRQAVLDRGLLTIPIYVTVLSLVSRLPTVDFDRTAVQPEAIASLPAGLARQLGVLPYWVSKDILRVAVEEPLSAQALDELATITGKQIRQYLAVSPGFTELIDHYYEQGRP